MDNNHQTEKDNVILQELIEENKQLRMENNFKSKIIEMLQDQFEVLENELLKYQQTIAEHKVAEITLSMFSQQDGGING